MRSRARLTPIFVLLPLLALTTLIILRVTAAVHHTLRHLPQVLEAQLTAALGREVKIGKVEWNFRHGLELHDVAVARAKKLTGGALLRVRRARVDYSLDAILSGKTPPLEGIQQIELDQPWIYIARDARGRLNLQDLAKPGPPRKGPPARFLGTVLIHGGTILFADRGVPGGRSITHRFTGIEATLDGGAAPLYVASVRARGDTGRLAHLAVHVSTNAEQRNTSVTARFQGINLPAWLAYLPPSTRLPARIEGGVADFEGSALVLSGKLSDYHGRLALRGGAARLKQLTRPLRDIAGTLDLTPDALVAENVRVRAGKVALTGSATLLNFRDPWLRVNLATSGIREADVRNVVPNLPPLPNVRLGRVDNLEVALRGPIRNPAVRVRTDITEVALPEVTLSGIHLEGRLAGRRLLVLDNLTGKAAGGSFTATATVALRDRVPRYQARGTLRGIRLEALTRRGRPGSSHPSGTANADFAVTGAGQKAQARARLDLFGATWQGWHADSLQAAVVYRDARVEVQRAQVRLPEGLLTAYGTVDPKGPVRLQVAASDLDLAALGRRFQRPEIGGTAHLRGEVSGTLAKPAFAGELTAYDLAYGADRLEMLRGKVSADLNEVRLDDFRGFMLPAQLSDVRLTVQNPRAGAKAEMEAVGNITGLDLGRLARRFRWQGDWGGTIDLEELAVTGPVNALRLSGLVTARHLRGAGRNLDYASGRVSVGLDGAVSVPQEEALTARVGTSEVRVWGAVSAERKLDVYVATAPGKAIHVEEIQAFAPETVSLKSSLGVNLHLTGTAADPEIRHGVVNVQELVVNGNAFGLGNGEIVASKKAVRIDNFVLIGADRPAGDEKREQYELNGAVWPRLDVTAVVQAAPIEKLLDLAHLSRPSPEIHGRVTALIKVAQGDPRPQVSLKRLVVDGGAVGPQKVKTLTAEGIALENDAVTLNRLHLELPEGATLQVTGKAALAEKGAVTFQVTGEKLDLALAQPWLHLPTALAGVGRLEATLGGTRESPTLAGSLSIANPGYGERFRFDSITARLAYAEGAARVQDLMLRKGDYTASGYAEIPVDWAKKAIPPGGSLRVHVGTEKQSLQALALFSPRVLETAGAFSAELNVGGTVSEPDLRGSVLVENGKILLGNRQKGQKPEEALSLTGLDGLIRLERDRIVVDHFYLASGKKPKELNPRALALTGEITLAQFLPDEFRLKVAARDYQFEERNLSGQFQEQVRFTLQGDGTVSGQWPTPLVTGDFALQHAKIDMTRFVAPPPAEARPPLAINPRFNVHLATKGQAEVLAMRTRAYADVAATLTGDLNAPVIESRNIKLASGSINLPTAHFRIKEAALDYLQVAPPRPFTATGKAVLTTTLRGKDPRKTGRAKTESYAVTANVFINYPGEEPVRMELAAQPFLDEDRIYGLLTRKDVIAGIVSGQEDIQATVKEEAMRYMATALQPQLIEPVERAIADALGLSEFSIMASFEEPVEVKLGKYLIKGVRVSYTRAVSARDARYNFKVDYEVIDRVALSWTTDERRSRTFGLEANFQF